MYVSGLLWPTAHVDICGSPPFCAFLAYLIYLNRQFVGHLSVYMGIHMDLCELDSELIEGVNELMYCYKL